METQSDYDINKQEETCPFCGGSPIIKDGIDKNCPYCGRWW